MSSRRLVSARSSVQRFAEHLQEQEAFSEDIAIEYYRMKRALAMDFQALALEAVPRDQYSLMDVKRAVADTMRGLFQGRVDASLLVIRRYTSPHPALFATLAARVGSPVPGWRLRILTGDKIHSERRTRELRDLGLQIDVAGKDDQATYCLKSTDADLVYGAAYQLRENAVQAKSLERRVRSYAIDLAQATAELPVRRLPDEL